LAGFGGGIVLREVEEILQLAAALDMPVERGGGERGVGGLSEGGHGERKAKGKEEDGAHDGGMKN
jgi:hypothetical protein